MKLATKNTKSHEKNSLQGFRLQRVSSFLCPFVFLVAISGFCLIVGSNRTVTLGANGTTSKLTLRVTEQLPFAYH